MSGPTLLNMPQAPSEPVTPSEAPGTPNSATTSMSELSTVAIKDGHRGHPHSHHHYSAGGDRDRSAPDTERIDRISRLPGLERLTAQRQTSSASIPPGGSASHPQGYFEQAIPPTHKDRSTVGSASATGSVGRTTNWAEGSEPTDATDKMSMSEDMSDGGASDENASLVGFGEGASSTMSGPTSNLAPGATRSSQRQRLSGLGQFRHGDQGRDPRTIDGMAQDDDSMMSNVGSTPPAGPLSNTPPQRAYAEDVSMAEGSEGRQR